MNMNTHVPDLPCLDCVFDDSPSYHQSLKYWGFKANEIGRRVHEVASGLHHYHDTGSLHHTAGNHLSEILSNASKFFQNDETLAQPLAKFSDALNRIECYQDMLLQQTQMLGVEPLMKMAQDVEKMKKCKSKLTKASELLHISWEKYANLPHALHLQEPQQLDRYAHAMITCREKYQLLLVQYTESIRNINTQKKVLLMQKVLEHMFAEFSFFNYCSQILKELEPYMNSVFEDLRLQLAECEKISAQDDAARRNIEAEINALAQKGRSAYPEGGQGQSSVQSTGRFLKQVGGFISSGVKDLKRTYKDGPPKEEHDWEVVDPPIAKEALDDNEDAPSRTTSISQATHFYLPLNEESREAVDLNIQSEVESLNNDKETKSNIDLENNIEEGQTTEQIVDVDGIVKNVTKKVNEFRKNNKVSPSHRSTHDNDFYKKGYLRIKQKAFPKSKYPLLYFILDKKYGELLSQGQDQKVPVSFAKLMLSAVKLCGEETDRNYCFQLVTSETEFTLQAESQKELEEWIDALQQGIATALTSCPDRQRSNARGRSVKNYAEQRQTDNTCYNAVERIKAVDGNLFCADCDSPRPGWASTNIGIVICIECSGVHRGLGVHVSKVKSLSLDKWDNELVEHMERHGNIKVNRLFEANLGSQNKITRESSKAERLDYITKKYVQQLFYVENDEVHHSGEEELFQMETTDATTDMSDHQTVQINSSVLCLVKDCEDCKAGRHGNINPPDDSSNFESSRLRFSPKDLEIDAPESTL